MRQQPLNKARPWRSWYQSAQWHRIRAKRLKAEPFCRTCAAAGVRTAAAVVDHTRPHRGDARLFFDFANTQSLCKQCHDGAKQSEERLGYSNQIGADGLPVDPRHPFNK